MIVLSVLILLVVLPAIVALLSEASLLPRPTFGVGAPIVYSHRESSTHPHLDARDLLPSPRGEFYYYNLVNYLRVTDVLDDGRIIAVARDNKRLCFWPDDSQFRKARLTERFFYRWRFPQV
jgi:hypothetical protein